MDDIVKSVYRIVFLHQADWAMPLIQDILKENTFWKRRVKMMDLYDHIQILRYD